MKVQCSKLATFTLCLTVLSACKESTPPASALNGHYVLVLVDDKTLPAVIAVSGFTGLQDRVSSGTLDFAGPKATQETRYDQRSTSDVVTPTVHDSIVGSFAMSGDLILLRRADNGVSVTDTAYVNESTLIVRQKLKTGLGLFTAQRFTLKYVREP